MKAADGEEGPSFVTVAPQLWKELQLDRRYGTPMLLALVLGVARLLRRGGRDQMCFVGVGRLSLARSSCWLRRVISLLVVASPDGTVPVDSQLASVGRCKERPERSRG